MEQKHRDGGFITLTLNENPNAQQIQILTSKVSAYDLSLSPDRKTIVSSYDDEMNLVSVDGKSFHPLCKAKVSGVQPSFAGNGKSIFFLSTASEPHEEGGTAPYGLWKVDITGKYAHKIWSSDYFADPLYYAVPTPTPESSLQ